MVPLAPFGDLAAANAAAAAWCAKVNAAMHSETCAVPAEQLVIERAMGNASPVMRGRHSAADGKACRRAQQAETGRQPDRLVSPARLAAIDDVGSGIGAVNFARRRYAPH
jgi:hypothetical protein